MTYVDADRMKRLKALIAENPPSIEVIASGANLNNDPRTMSIGELLKEQLKRREGNEVLKTQSPAVEKELAFLRGIKEAKDKEEAADAERRAQEKAFEEEQRLDAIRALKRAVEEGLISEPEPLRPDSFGKWA